MNLRALGHGVIIAVLAATLVACTSPSVSEPTAVVQPESSASELPSSEPSTPTIGLTGAVLRGVDPVDTARRQVAIEASQSPDRFSAELIATVDDSSSSWARVVVRDSTNPPAYDDAQVLLESVGANRQWHVVAYGSGLGLPPEDLVSYGMSLDAARRLFPE